MFLTTFMRYTLAKVKSYQRFLYNVAISLVILHNRLFIAKYNSSVHEAKNETKKSISTCTSIYSAKITWNRVKLAAVGSDK